MKWKWNDEDIWYIIKVIIEMASPYFSFSSNSCLDQSPNSVSYRGWGQQRQIELQAVATFHLTQDSTLFSGTDSTWATWGFEQQMHPQSPSFILF